jgi:recombination protein RecA
MNKKQRLHAIGDRQADLLMGTLLGDAFFPKMAVRQKNRSIRWEHGAEQKDYAVWKAEQVGLDWTPFERSRFDKRTGKTYSSFTACLKAHPGFNALYEQFCKEDKKIVTMELLTALTPEAIAIWYCDDGNLYWTSDTKHLTISTQCFSDAERQTMIRFFKDKFDLDFRINQKAIRLVSMTEIEKFLPLVEPFVPKCMRYKIERCA